MNARNTVHRTVPHLGCENTRAAAGNPRSALRSETPQLLPMRNRRVVRTRLPMRRLPDRAHRVSTSPAQRRGATRPRRGREPPPRLVTAPQRSPACDPSAREAMTSRADQGKQPFWGPGQPLVVDQWSSQFGAAEVPVHRNLQDLARRAKSCKIPRTTTRNLDRISTNALCMKHKRRVMSPRHSLPRRYGAHPSRGCRRGLNPPVSSRLLAM